MKTEIARMPNYFHETFSLRSNGRLNLRLGSRYGDQEGTNPYARYSTEIVVNAFKHLVNKLELGGHYVTVTIHRNGGKYGDILYRVEIDEHVDASFMVSGYPACCGTYLLHSFQYAQYGSQVGYTERALMLCWLFATFAGTMMTGTVQALDNNVNTYRQRFNAILVYSTSAQFETHLRRMDTEAAEWDNKWLDDTTKRFPVFHDFCNKLSTVNGRAPFYNINSGNICETVVVVPPTVKEFLKNASPIAQ